MQQVAADHARDDISIPESNGITVVLVRRGLDEKPINKNTRANLEEAAKDRLYNTPEKSGMRVLKGAGEDRDIRLVQRCMYANQDLSRVLWNR